MIGLGDMADFSNKKVSLVLGGGGARGLAHIGVIEWLCDNGFEIRSISGSSMGALVGGIYATGKLDVYTHWVKTLQKKDVLRILDLSFSRTALFKGERIIQILKDLIGDYNIEDLPISFTAVATDINTQSEVWLKKGSLFTAIRASIATPIVFAPIKYQDRYLLDGSIVNPIPIAPTLNDDTDLTIAVNLGAKPQNDLSNGNDKGAKNTRVPRSDGNGANGYRIAMAQWLDTLQDKLGQRASDEMAIIDIVSKSIDAMQNTITRFKLASYSPHVIVEVPRNICGFFDFYRAAEIIEVGRQKADEALRLHVRKREEKSNLISIQ